MPVDSKITAPVAAAGSFERRRGIGGLERDIAGSGEARQQQRPQYQGTSAR